MLSNDEKPSVIIPFKKPSILLDASTPLETVSRCTVVGAGVPVDGMTDGTLRIGSGAVYLQISDGQATIVGAESDVAVQRILRGIEYALSLNPHYHRWLIAAPTPAVTNGDGK